jgi:hypothetical protein
MLLLICVHHNAEILGHNDEESGQSGTLLNKEGK